MAILNFNKVVGDVLNKVDDSSLTPAEKAEGTVSMMERLGQTPSSKTRRHVTWFLLGYVVLFSLLMVVAYWAEIEIKIGVQVVPLGDKLLEVFKEMTSNSVMLSIVGFFYGGYYINKALTPAAKERLMKKKQEREQDAVEHSIKMDKKRTKIEYKDRNS